MARVRIAVRDRERIHDPRQSAIVAEHDVRIRIVGEEWRECRYSISHVASHQQLAILIHVIAERQLREIAAVERDNDAAQKTAEYDTAVALVRR